MSDLPLSRWAVRLVRRRRGRTGTPHDRVVGAWREAHRALARSPARQERRALRAMTAEELARWAHGRLGPDAGSAVATLGRCHTRAVFADRPVTPAHAAEAWTAASRIRAEAARHRRLGPRWRSQGR